MRIALTKCLDERWVQTVRSTDTHNPRASDLSVIPLGALAAHDLLALCQLDAERYPVLLESAAARSADDVQYDILMAFPGAALRWVAGHGLQSTPELDLPRESFLSALDAWWRHERCAQVDTALPFAGGWFVYLSYELASQIEPVLSGCLPVAPNQLLALAMRIPVAVIRNTQSGEAWFVAESAYAEVLAELHSDLQRVRDKRTSDRSIGILALHEDAPDRFIDSVLAAQAHIAAGDIYQANLSRGWVAQLSDGVMPADVYRQLRRSNPAPFAALARLDADHSLISSSPERLLRVKSGVASTRPIAGTRPRAQEPAADRALVEELRSHPKERAEHIMLLDLERNDLGRICTGGSVRVNEYMTIESYAHVHHIVSNVEGQIRLDVTPGQAIAAVFPGGTITGCPKVRCVQIIAEEEGVARGAYTGSMGYLNRDGSMDLNILIRTLEMQGSELRFRAGAGIVADSVAERELDETRAKALGMLRALPMVKT